jgi:hypothetical protein
MMTRVSQQSQSRLDQEPYFSLAKQLIEAGDTNSEVAHRITEDLDLPTTEKSIRRFRKRNHIGAPCPEGSRKGSVRYHDGDQADVTTPAGTGLVLDDPDTMLRERGLNPKDWVIDGATVNEWDGPSQEGPVTYHQAKLHIKRKRPELQVIPARSDGWTAPPRAKASNNKTKLIVVTGDQQAPFHDEKLHYLFCGWLEENEPDQGVALGDKVDFPDISRHRLDPENTAKVNECVQSGYDLFRGYRTASLDTEWLFMPGNHDERIRNILLDKPSVQPLYGVKRATPEGEEDEKVLTLPHLLRLDELGITYVDPEGPYDMAQISLSSKLAVRHGWIARQGSGVTALATLEHLGYSVIVGHSHRQSLVYKTTHDIEGGTTTLTAAEAGCMCRIDQQGGKGVRKFPDFSVLPDWQQGFATVTLHPDGLFRIEHATYVNGVLLWRDQRYK